MRKMNNKAKSLLFAVIIIIVISMVILVVWISSSSNDYIENDSSFGKFRTKIILVLEDGSTKTLQFGSGPLMSVFHYSTKVVAFKYYLTAMATSSSYEGVLINKNNYKVQMNARPKSGGSALNTWSLIPSADNDELWDYNVKDGYKPGQIWIPCDGTEYSIMKVYVDIDDPMPSSLPTGDYMLDCEAGGKLFACGYKISGEWDTEEVETGLPSDISIYFTVKSDGSFIITYGQGWQSNP